MHQEQAQGFQTGDMVRAIVPKGTKMGVWGGRVAVRKTGSFNVRTVNGAVQGILHKYCTLTQRADGYGHHIQPNQGKEKGDRENESR
jgi:hypothetical protein